MEVPNLCNTICGEFVFQYTAVLSEYGVIFGNVTSLCFCSVCEGKLTLEKLNVIIFIPA